MPDDTDVLVEIGCRYDGDVDLRMLVWCNEDKQFQQMQNKTSNVGYRGFRNVQPSRRPSRPSVRRCTVPTVENGMFMTYRWWGDIVQMERSSDMRLVRIVDLFADLCCQVEEQWSSLLSSEVREVKKERVRCWRRKRSRCGATTTTTTQATRYPSCFILSSGRTL